MKPVEHAKRLAQDCGGAHLAPTAVQELLAVSGLGIEQLMLELIPLAKSFAKPAISNFSVGAVARGVSGALCLGANLEFAECPLGIVGHQGPHGWYNDMVLDRLQTAIRNSSGSAASAIVSEIKQIRWELRNTNLVDLLKAAG